MTQSKLSAPTLQNFVNGSLRANLNQAGIGLDSDRYHSIPMDFTDAYSWSSVVMNASRLFWETLQCRVSNEPARSSGSQSEVLVLCFDGLYAPVEVHKPQLQPQELWNLCCRR